MKKKILVVDDDESTRETIREWLELHGYEVETAENGNEGITLFKKYSDFDLIITDFRMPKMNGIEVIRFIKLNFPGIKTVLITGDDIKLVSQVAVAAGADKVLSKPLDFQGFQRTVKELLT